MRLKFVAVALMIALLGTFVIAPMTTSAKQQTAAPIPVTGVLTDGGTFTGTVSDLVFGSQGGNLTVSGVLNGTVTDAAGVVTEVTNFAFTTVAAVDVSGVCEILDLTIGPINLDLLGLVVDIDQIDIQITAESGPGNLLGNLLCGTAGLLDGNAPASALARLLNQLIGLLG